MKERKKTLVAMYALMVLGLSFIFSINFSSAETVLCQGPDGCGPGPAPCPQGLTQVASCPQTNAPGSVTKIFCQGPDGCGERTEATCPTGFIKVASCPQSGSTGVAATSASTVFVNPLKFDTVEGFLAHFLTILQQIIVTLSLVFIVIGAVMYIISAGSSDMIGKAKGTITASLIGLALGIAAPSFLKEISLVLGWGPTGSQEVDSALTLTEIALNVLNFLLAAVGIMSILMMVLGGVMYLTSAGDEDRIDTGKKITKNAIIGIIISLSAMVLVRQIAEFFAA